MITARRAVVLPSYAVSPSDDCFVTKEVKVGILPQILDEILAARKQAKKDMKNATDPAEKAVQNGRQLALKVREVLTAWGWQGNERYFFLLRASLRG